MTREDRRGGKAEMCEGCGTPACPGLYVMERTAPGACQSWTPRGCLNLGRGREEEEEQEGTSRERESG